MTLPCGHDESRLSTITVKGRKPYQRCRECHRLAEDRRRNPVLACGHPESRLKLSVRNGRTDLKPRRVCRDCNNERRTERNRLKRRGAPTVDHRADRLDGESPRVVGEPHRDGLIWRWAA